MGTTPEAHSRVAVVTGASSGIGEATARTLAALGFHVVAVARRADRIQRLADEIGGTAAVADVTDAAAVNALAGRLPRVDVLVNNAGGARGLEPVAEADLENLRRKCDAGGDVVITQLFYDNADFLRFRDACDRIGIRAPIGPGVMPVTNYAQIRRIASLCKARLPEAFTSSFEAAGDDEAAQFEAGVTFATRQVRELIDEGVPGIHFYVLNRSPATVRVLEDVGLSRGVRG